MIRATLAIITLCIFGSTFGDAWQFHDKPKQQAHVEHLYPATKTDLSAAAIQVSCHAIRGCK